MILLHIPSKYIPLFFTSACNQFPVGKSKILCGKKALAVLEFQITGSTGLCGTGEEILIPHTAVSQYLTSQKYLGRWGGGGGGGGGV
jgi:hypothetical protein